MNKLLNLLLLLLFSVSIRAQPVPAQAMAVPDEAAFLVYLSQQLQQALPEYRFRVSGRSIWGENRSGEPLGQFDPVPTHQRCLREPVQCPQVVEQYVSTVSELARIRRHAPNVSQLRLTLRPARFVADVRQQSGPTVLYSQPAPGDMLAVPILDYQSSLRYVGEGELKRLGLTEAQLFEISRRNMLTALLPLKAIAPRLPPNDFGRIEAEDHTASRVLMHEDWAELAAQMKESLIVMVPTPNNLFFTDSANVLQVLAMQRVGQDMYRASARALSLQLLRWTPSGWENWTARSSTAQ